MNIDIWKEMERKEVLWVLNQILPNVVEDEWDVDAIRSVRTFSDDLLATVPDRLTYMEGALAGAQVGAALSAYTFGISIVPMTLSGIGIGLALAHLID